MRERKMESLKKPQIICHSETVLSYAVHDVKWIPSAAKFVSIGGKSNGAGIVEIYELDVDKGPEKVSEFCKKEHFKCGTFQASSLRKRHLATGDFAGRLQLWDLENNLVPVFKATHHKAVINTIDGVGGTGIGHGAPELATGSRDGIVMVWDVRQSDPVAEFRPAEGAKGRDCWAVAFGNSYNDEERCLAAGYDNGDIQLYDLRTMTIRWKKCVKNGVVGLQFDRRDIEMNKLVATTLESKIFCFDMRTFHPEKGYACRSEKAHNSTVWCVQHLPQNREIFMTTGGSGSLCLWKYNYPSRRSEKDTSGVEYGVAGELERLQNSTISSQPVTAFDWCTDKIGLSVCSALDQTLRILITTKLNLY